MVLSWMQLVGFCVLVLIASASLLGPQYPESRGEQLLATFVGALGLVLVPIHLLAWTMLLSRASVVTSIGVLSLAVLGFALRRSRWPLALEASLQVVRAPWDALRYAWAERHVAGLGLLAFAAIALYTLRLAYLAPSTTWDGLWYHEAIVGFTLQLRGVADAAVESRHQYVNGYPALAEYLQLFAVVAGRRDLIDTVPTVMGGVLLVASYAFLRRYVERMQALGFALAIVLVPAVVLQFRSTLVDVSVAAFAAACMALLTRPVLRWVDVLLAALAIAMLAGSKASAAFMAALYALLLAARLMVAAWRGRRIGRGASQLLAAAVIVLAIGAPRYVSNLEQHGNPIWPLPFRGAGLSLKGKRNAAPPDKSATELIASLLSPPHPGGDAADSRDNGYGNAIPYTILPLALLALLALPLRLLWDRVRDRPIAAAEATLLGLALASGAGLYLVPAVWWARLHLHAVVIAVALTAWLLRAPATRRFSDALIGALLLSELVTLSWSTSAWGVSRAQASELADLSASERRIRDLGSTLRFPEPIARALEREVPAGALVLYDGPYLFLANLWNARFSNRVSYLECAKEGYAERAVEAGAKWLIVGSDPCKKQLDASAAWERVGNVDRGTIAYRRQRAKPQPIAADPPAPPPVAPPSGAAFAAPNLDCHAHAEVESYVAPVVPEADQQAAAHSRKLKGDGVRLYDGPIVGAVTDRSATIWVRTDRAAAWQLEYAPADHPRQVERIDGEALTPAADFTGTVALTKLHPGTRYRVRVAVRDPASPPANSPIPLDWEASFRTLPPPFSHGQVRIAVGADITHDMNQPIFTQLEAAAPDAVFLIGDQMYADAVGPDFAGYANKYAQAWRIDQLRNMLSNFPVFMIWDDHEIVDDYFAGKTPRFAPARLAYDLFVQRHNPAPLRRGKLYYPVQIGDVGFFVLDTRSDRMDPALPDDAAKSMLGAEQKADLFHWLACNKSAIKVIVSTVVMSEHVNGHDSWNAYSTEREEIFSFIEREKIDNVVILSGDQHWSAVFLHDRPHSRLYEFLPTPLSKERATAPTAPASDILARDDDNFVFGVVDFDTTKSPAHIAFTLCALGKPCKPGKEPAPKTGLNLRGAEENVPFTFRFTAADIGVR